MRNLPVAIVAAAATVIYAYGAASPDTVPWWLSVPCLFIGGGGLSYLAFKADEFDRLRRRSSPKQTEDA